MSVNDVLLIYPGLDASSVATMERPLMPPLGLSYLAAMLMQHGYPVRIFDNSLEKKTRQEVAALVRECAPLFVGVSCLSANYLASVALVEEIRAISAVPVVVGGPHPTMLPETFQLPCIDYICLGEGELTLLELAEYLRERKGDLAAISGLWYRREGVWTSTGRRAAIGDLNILPHPARQLLQISRYQNQTEEVSASPVLSMNTSRGCPYSCSFCSVQGVWGRTYRTFSIDWILDDLGEVIGIYGARGVYFYEDNFTLSAERVEAICDGILARGYQIKWACEGRIGSLSLPLLKKMKLAGCETVKFGIESGSPRILELIAKEVSLDKVLETRELCREAGIKFACFFLIGIPTETEEDRQMTLDFIRLIGPDQLVLNVYIPMPDSPLYRQLLASEQPYRKDGNFILHRPPEEQADLDGWANRIISVWRNSPSRA